MASGLVNSSSYKAFDLASDDVLCSYNEFNQENGTKVIPDLENGEDFSKDFQRNRMTKCSSGVVYNRPDESPYQDILSLVEKCMKRHSDDIMRVLEGISSRLSHLELYCYNVDKSVGEMRLNMGRDYEETDARLQSLDKHLVEVSRSVQILRDKQELAETQKVIAKLQLAQNELSSPKTPQHNIEGSASPTSDHHKTDDMYEIQNQHLAIVLHHQVAPQQQSSPLRPVEVRQPVAPTLQVAPQHITQHQHYYPTSAPYQVQVQTSQGQYLTSDTQYHTPQSQQPDTNCVQFQQVPAQVSQAPPKVHFIQYQQQPQQPQQMMSGQLSFQQPPTPATGRPQSTLCYPPQRPSQSFLQVPREAVSASIHSHTPFSSMPQQVVTCTNAMSNGYGGGPVQLQPPPQQIKENFGAPCGEIYKSVGPHHSLSPATAAECMLYGNDEVKRQASPQSQFPQGSHFLATVPRQHPHVSIIHNPSQAPFTRNLVHNELIDKLVNMGLGADHVAHVIQLMEESGQAIDYSSVLKKLNVQSSGLHRGWTG